jgi:hypothetical protein
MSAKLSRRSTLAIGKLQFVLVTLRHVAASLEDMASA